MVEQKECNQQSVQLNVSTAEKNYFRNENLKESENIFPGQLYYIYIQI